MRMGQDEETNGLGSENIALYRQNKRNVTNPKTFTNSFDRLVVGAGICPLPGSGVTSRHGAGAQQAAVAFTSQFRKPVGAEKAKVTRFGQ
jgi:hypothetical protein